MRALGIDIAWQSVLCGLYRGMFCAEHFGSHFLQIVAHFDMPIWNETKIGGNNTYMCSMHGVTDVLFLPKMDKRTKIGIGNRLEREHCIALGM